MKDSSSLVVYVPAVRSTSRATYNRSSTELEVGLVMGLLVEGKDLGTLWSLSTYPCPSAKVINDLTRLCWAGMSLQKGHYHFLCPRPGLRLLPASPAG